MSTEELFRFYWLDGKVEELPGHSAVEALNRAGYGNGALRALDFWEHVEDEDNSDE